jgi:Flp pilus assembly protein TadG
MTVLPRPRIITCRDGAMAVEFALVLPALVMLSMGILSAGLLVYSAASLHYAAEAAARCYSVNATQCSSAPTTQTYAHARYFGPSSPTFTASIPSCGHQVSATLTFVLDTGLKSWSIPLSATACFP